MVAITIIVLLIITLGIVLMEWNYDRKNNTPAG